jgi:hypothetical protein
MAPLARASRLVLGFVRTVMAKVGRGVMLMAVVTGRAVGVLLAHVGTVLSAIGRPVGRLVVAVVAGVGRGVVVVARGVGGVVGPVVVGIGRLVVAVVAGVGRGVWVVLRGIGGAAVVVALVISRSSSVVATAVRGVVAAVALCIVRYARRVGRRVWPVCAPVGRGVAIIAVAAYRAIRRSVKASVTWTKSRVVHPLGRAFRWIVSTAIIPLLRRLRLAGRRMVAGGQAVVASVWRMIPVERLRDSLEALCALPSILTQSAYVAVGAARHRATGLASAGRRDRTDWQAAATPLAPADGDGRSTFSIDVDHNSCLAPGHNRITAVLSVTCDESGSDVPPGVVEVILLDCSASMGQPWDKIREARIATRAAVESLRDGVWFAVVRGADDARVAYPRRGGLVQASARTKREAARVIQTLQPVGGTAIGRWLRLARDLMALRPEAIHHAILLTDGKNENESAQDLYAAIASCEGAFQCDCRGVGTDWAVDELRAISSALLGSLDIIREPVGMKHDFRRMTAVAMARSVEAVLHVWTPTRATVNFFGQVSPTIEELTSRGRRVGPLTSEYRTGAWGSERREYLLSVDLAPEWAGNEVAAARVSVVVGSRQLSRALVRAVWTEDRHESAVIRDAVAHYTGQLELAQSIREGLQARRDDDEVGATLRLGRAVQLASQTGNDAVGRLLARVVEVVDAETGIVRMKEDVDASDEMTLDTRSTRSVRAGVRVPTREATG